MRFTALNIAALSIFCLTFVMGSTVWAQDYPHIDTITVEGTQRIEIETVKTYIDIKEGDPLTPQVLDKALKNLFATGLFADVQLNVDTDDVLITVIENPIINKIAFEGNDKLEKESLLAEIQLRSRQVFTRTKVQSDVERLYEIYRRNGRFAVQIDPKIIRLDQNRINLVFEINEGPTTKVQGIRFIGNNVFDDSVLNRKISTREAAWYRFLSSADKYDPDRLSFDQDLLRRFYLSQGYADFRVESAFAELAPDRNSFFVTFTVHEGERYRIGNITIDSHLRDVDGESLRPQITTLPDEWYDADQVEESVDLLSDTLGDMQYAFVDVRPGTTRRAEGNVLDIKYTINETPKVYVERINIDGNLRTLDKVIRREFELVEGDPYAKSKLAKSERKIRDLGYFESVEVKESPGSAPDRVELDVNVAEKSTGELSLGAGFSTNDGPLADMRIRERNFLGKGQDLLLAATVSGERTEYDLSFTEPYFLNRDLSAGVDLFHITRDLQDESSFDQTRTGGSLRMGYPLSEKWRQNLRYRIEQNEITDVDPGASRFIRDQEGERITSAISQRLTYTDLDSRLFPTDGTSYWLDTELAGFGGDAFFVSGKTGASWYYPLAEGWVLNTLGEVGAITGYSDEDVFISDRFFLGGSTLRGFERAGVGPRDLVTDDSLGGNTFYRGSVELTTPTPLPEEIDIKAHIFTDFGSLFSVDDNGNSAQLADESSLRATIGVGLSWRSPLGPIRVDIATPYLDEDFDETEVFRFNFGTRF